MNLIVTEEINNISEIKGRLWGQAVKIAERIEEATGDIAEASNTILETRFENHVSITELNDYLSYYFLEDLENFLYEEVELNDYFSNGMLEEIENFLNEE